MMKGWVGLVGWPTADGLPASGHPSATGRAQDSKSSPVRDRRSTTVPYNQHNGGDEDEQYSLTTGMGSHFKWSKIQILSSKL